MGNPENHKAVTLLTLQMIDHIMESQHSHREVVEAHLSLIYQRLDLLTIRLNNQSEGDWDGEQRATEEKVMATCQKQMALMESQTEHHEAALGLAYEALTKAVELLGKA